MTEKMVTGKPIERRPRIDFDLPPSAWVLSFVAGRTVALRSQAEKLLTIRDEVSTNLLTQLSAERLIVDAPCRRHQGAFQVTAAGLRAIGSDLSVPRVDVRRYWSEVAAGWLAVRTRLGIFGPEIERLYTRREMEAADRRMAEAAPLVDPSWSDAVRAKAADASFAAWLRDPSGREGEVAHYPDQTVVIPQGRVAMELLLTLPGRGRLEAIIGAYARKPQLASTILIVPSAAMREAVADAIGRCGAEERVYTQHARFALW